MSSVDTLGGDRIETETASRTTLVDILAQYDHYYPEDKSNGLEWGLSYYTMMRDQADEIIEELKYREGE